MVKAMTLRTQLVLLQVVIVLAIVLTAGLAAMLMQERQIREASQERMVAVAQSVAQLPTIVEAYGSPDPSSVIQPIAELIRDSSNVAYVVVTDDQGIRFSHPNPDRIGEPVSTDPSVALSGETYVGTQTGTLGESWRVKVPVFDADGDVIGQVSVGILESALREDFMGDIAGFLLALGVATVIGVIAATGVARMVRRRIYGLEPDDIRGLLETREATLHGIREGMLALDEQGVVSLCNDAAARLLGMSGPADAVGRPASELLDGLADLITETEVDDDAAPQRLVLSGERVLVARAAPVRVQERRVGTVLTLMDRTELDRALRELAGAQSLAEGLRAQQHEFSNTLHTIGGLIELGEFDAARRVVDRAGDGGALSRLDAPDGVQDIELAAILLAKRARARELGVNLTISDDSLFPARSGDGDLGTVVANLLDNALDAAGHGGHVVISIEQAGDSGICIRVEDDGPGVPMERRGDVFRLGYSTKTDDRQRGYGLTLVARVVDRLGGSVELSPAASGGARFTVRIPAAALADADA
ncbi:ATP-binding protein [Microbacterium murale]|uniref:histidine kinase n=1 Tax=Microbacterium murale TaxID=1081040 RepID=A0ABU0P563_9MICO|nr:sensor histidine kinase [Microbacterium murale]MDQ0641846.1 two-component system CitB family sensor kinase [Microbacterium murale]